MTTSYNGLEIITNKDGTRIFVLVDVISNDLGERILPVHFLLDIGADVTTIHPLDALDNGVDFSRLEKQQRPSIGVGGVQDCEYVLKDVTLKFPLVNGEYAYATLKEIDIVQPSKNHGADSPAFHIPSLLGTDVLKLLKLTYNSNSKLELKNKDLMVS